MVYTDIGGGFIVNSRLMLGKRGNTFDFRKTMFYRKKDYHLIGYESMADYLQHFLGILGLRVTNDNHLVGRSYRKVDCYHELGVG